jgi:glycosyltransferase involved in cell wall biosynthesis
MSLNELDLSLIIACYNEELLLEESVRQTVQVLDNTPWSYEIIFVDDCSWDRTTEIIEELIAQYQDKRFRKLFHKENRGRGRTVADGIRIARGAVAGYIDIDLEVHARYIAPLTIAVRNGADIATANRIYKLHPKLLHRFILSNGYKWLMHKLLNVNLKDTETGFKFFRRDKILPILDQIEDEGWFWDTEIMVRSLLRGYKIMEIPCLFVKRYDKTSTVSPLSDSLEYLGKLWRFRKVVGEIRGDAAGQHRAVVPMPKAHLDVEK